MIIDKNSSVDYKDWIEVSHDGNRQVTDQLMKALKSTKIDDFRSIHYLGEGVYVKGVAYDESTKVLTFTLSDGSSLSVKLTGDVDLSDYATKEDLNSKVDKIEGKNLSTNDFTDKDKEKLSFLSNYDDSELRELVSTKANVDDTYTKSEVDNLVSSINTNLSWKESVPTYDDILTTYPNPKDGWTVNVDDTDVTYRYTGTEWIAISANSIPLATKDLDGRMSKEDKSKLDNLSNYDDSSLVSKVNLKADKEYVDSEISELDSKSVKFSEFTYGTDPKVRKTIQLSNYDSISGISTKGVGVNIAMVNKWDVVDLGSTSLPINLNTPKGVRPTAQEPGQSGDEANKLAYLSDIENLATKDELSSAIENLPKPVDSYTKSEVDTKLLEKVDVTPGMQLSHNDFTTDEKIKLASIDPESYALKSELSNKVDKVEGKVLSSNDFTNEDKSELAKLRTDVDYVGQRIDEANTNTAKALNSKVDWDSEKKVISLPKDGSISALRNEDTLEGGVLLAQRTYDEGVTFVTEVGTTKNNLTLNSSERPQVDIKGGSREKLAYVSDLLSNENKTKLAGIEDNAQVNKIESIKINGLAQEIGADDKSVDIDLSGKADIEDVYSKDEIDTKLTKTVTWSYSSSEPDKKVITLENGELIMGRTNPDSEIQPDPATSALTIAQVNKWNIIDFGSPKSVINFNIHKGYRPTVQESGQSGEDAHKIAYVSDIPSGDITSLLSRISQLEDRISNINKTNIEPIVIEGTPTEEYTDSTKDYQVSGVMTSGTPVSISGKSVSVDNISLSNDTRLKLKASEDIDIKNSTISGDFPKTNGNSAISINNSGYIVIKDMTIDATLYNAIEIGLSEDSLVNGVLIDNCKFRGQFSNNAILIFGVKDNAVININNCYFENVSNCIRLSNKYNTKCTVNITNCTCDKWDTNSPWQGMMIFQDYTSKSLELEESNNLFSKDKVTVNVSNFNGPSGKLETPSDISSICGTGDENQVFYVWNSIGQSIPYGDGSRYPSINIV